MSLCSGNRSVDKLLHRWNLHPRDCVNFFLWWDSTAVVKVWHSSNCLRCHWVLLSLGASWSDTHISPPTWQHFNRWTVRNDKWNDITAAWNKIEAAAADVESREENRCFPGGSIDQGRIEQEAMRVNSWIWHFLSKSLNSSIWGGARAEWKLQSFSRE